jgi:hypothetical protein
MRSHIVVGARTLYVAIAPCGLARELAWGGEVEDFNESILLLLPKEDPAVLDDVPAAAIGKARPISFRIPTIKLSAARLEALPRNRSKLLRAKPNAALFQGGTLSSMWWRLILSPDGSSCGVL